jgi:hypothetical protein
MDKLKTVKSIDDLEEGEFYYICDLVKVYDDVSLNDYLFNNNGIVDKLNIINHKSGSSGSVSNIKYLSSDRYVINRLTPSASKPLVVQNLIKRAIYIKKLRLYKLNNDSVNTLIFYNESDIGVFTLISVKRMKLIISNNQIYKTLNDEDQIKKIKEFLTNYLTIHDIMTMGKRRKKITTIIHTIVKSGSSIPLSLIKLEKVEDKILYIDR